MATSITLYNDFAKEVGKGTIDLDSDTIKIALVTSSYTFSADHTVWANVSANEVATGSGYTTGGATLASVTFARSGSVVTFDAADVTWAGLTKTFRFGIIYDNVTRNSLTNPLIAAILFDTAPADIVISGIAFSIVWGGNGILTFTQS